MRNMLALGAAAVLSTSCATIQLSEDHFFHPGPAEQRAAIAAPGANVEPVTLTTADGTTLAGAYITTPAATVDILYFGGNVSRIDEYAGAMAATMLPLQANLFVADYRGYGRSGGTPAIETLKADALALFDELQRRAGARPIVVHGLSLGSFMAAQRPVGGLVLESSAPDLQEWVRASVPGYAKPFIRVKIAPALLRESNAAALRQYSGPLLVVTGSNDSTTPPRLSQALFAAATSPDKRIFIVPGATHGNAFAFPAAQQEYASFLERVRTR